MLSVRRPTLHSTANGRAHPSTLGRARRAPLTRAQAGKADDASVVKPGDLIFVAGAGGGVGQLITAKLLDRGLRVRALERGTGKIQKLFGDKVELMMADLREKDSIGQDAFKGVRAVCCATGTTAFPSARWENNNGPRPTDWQSMVNLIDAVPKDVARFVYVTSAGVERQGSFPWAILNLFGVLKYKHDSELYLARSGLKYSVLRPSRLTDGPYTSYDLNTLLQSTSGSRRAVTLSPRDDLAGEASRIAVAEAAIQCLLLPETVNHMYGISSVEGDGPDTDTKQWARLFASAS